MLQEQSHYLKEELYDLIKSDDRVFDFLQNGSLDGIWYWDINNPEHEWMSDRFWTVLGYDPKEKEHRADAWQDIIFKEDLATAVENFNKHCECADHPYDQIVRYRHADGSTVWIRCRGIAIRDEQGKAIRMLGAHTDVTSLKNTEQELKKKTLKLEQINSELSKFAYIASHDLRSPLQTISGFVEILEVPEQSEEQQQVLDFIKQGTVRMKELIDGLLNFAHLNQIDEQVEEVDSAITVKEVCQQLDNSLKEIDATVEILSLPVIRAVPFMLRQVFQNLIQNSIKFKHPDRLLEIQISAIEEDEYWHFFVKDNAIGIGEKHHEKIFELFSRLHPWDEIKGCGLGLAACAKAVMVHEGKIEVDSDGQTGSTFHFTISKELF